MPETQAVLALSTGATASNAAVSNAAYIQSTTVLHSSTDLSTDNTVGVDVYGGMSPTIYRRLPFQGNQLDGNLCN